jgi:predicted DNA-binding transcriptional regulator YafY
LVEREVGSDRVVARRRNGAIEVAVPAGNPSAFASWVLGLTDHAEVLSPKAVRDDVVNRLRALAAPSRRPRTQQRRAR